MMFSQTAVKRQAFVAMVLVIVGAIIFPGATRCFELEWRVERIYSITAVTVLAVGLVWYCEASILASIVYF
jgi:hypothetical protein